MDESGTALAISRRVRTRTDGSERTDAHSRPVPRRAGNGPGDATSGGLSATSGARRSAREPGGAARGVIDVARTHLADRSQQLPETQTTLASSRSTSATRDFSAIEGNTNGERVERMTRYLTQVNGFGRIL